MTIAGRPSTTTRVTRTREVKHVMPPSIHKAAIVYWARRNYPEFRGFADDEIDLEYLDNGEVQLHAFKETTK